MDEADVPLRVSLVGDHPPQTDAAVQVPGVPWPGVPLDPAQAASPGPTDDRTDYTDTSVLRAGDSGQTCIGVIDSGGSADLSGGAGSAGSDADGD